MSDEFENSQIEETDLVESENADAEAQEAEDQQILALAKKRFKLAQEAWTEIHEAALSDLKFRAALNNDQWDPDILAARKKSGRPSFTVNKIPQFCRQITNEMRQNKPSIKVFPVDDVADPETAKILQGMTRNIEYSSNAQVAYNMAGEGAVNKSFGFYRITTDYVSPDSFDQEIQIKQIADHFAVLLDPASQEPDGSDANYGFVVEELSKDEFKAEYPDARISAGNEWESSIAASDGWIDDAKVRVAEYFYKEFKKETLCLLSDDVVIYKSKLPKKLPEGVTVVKEREALIPTIKHCKINGDQIIKRTIWLGSWIPIIPVYGSRLYIEGKWILESVFRHSKDPQKLLNYYTSSEAEAIALAPKAPYIVADEQVEPYKREWKTANTENHAFLRYKPVTEGGVMVPPPQRNSYEPAIMATTNARLQANDDIKATTGIYDDSLGRNQQQKSGVALARTQQQSQTSNFHFIDNLACSIQHGGRIIVELIPKIYDRARMSRIIGEDGTQEIIKVNQEFERGGKKVNYNLNSGKYDVVVETGPSYATKRQEAADMMMEFLRVNPTLAPLIADLVAKNMDWPGAQELYERIRKTIDPKLLENKDQAKESPESIQKMQAAQQMIDQLTAKLNEATEEKAMKQLELESKERIEFAKMQNQLALEAVKSGSKEALAIFAADQRMISDRLNQLDMSAPINTNFNGTGPQGQIPNNFTGEVSPGAPTGGESPGLNNGATP